MPAAAVVDTQDTEGTCHKGFVAPEGVIGFHRDEALVCVANIQCKFRNY